VSDIGIVIRIPIAILVNIAHGLSTLRIFHRYTMSHARIGVNLVWTSFGKINHDPRRPPNPPQGRDNSAFTGADEGQYAKDRQAQGGDKGAEK